MADKFYAGAYWAARSESVEDCAGRLARFLALLASAHPLFGTWFESDGPGQPAAEDQAQTAARLREILEEGRSRTDTDGPVIEELGYSAGLWNGSGVAHVGLLAFCGSHSQWVGNSVVVNLPAAEGDALDLYRPDVARTVMTALASCWEPAWGTLTTNSLRRAQRPPPGAPIVGWMTYLARPRRVDASRLPAGVTAEELTDGTLVTIAQNVAEVTEPLVVAVRDSLNDAVSPSP